MVCPSSDGGSTITNYMIYRGTSSGTETLLATIGNVLAYTDTGVTNDQIYYYKVKAVNIVGEGAYSNEVHATPSAGGEEEIEIPFLDSFALIVGLVLFLLLKRFRGGGSCIVLESSILCGRGHDGRDDVQLFYENHDTTVVEVKSRLALGRGSKVLIERGE